MTDISLLIPTLTAAVLGILGYFMRRLITAHDKLDKAFWAEQRRIQDELTTIRGAYLKHEEFVRFQSNIDHKLTKIYDLLVGR